MGYEQALEHQLSALRFVTSHGRNLADYVTDGPPAITEDVSLGAVRAILTTGDPVYWSPAICDVLEATAPTMPEWTLREEDLPTERGYCWFARPLPLPVPEGATVRVPMVAFCYARIERHFYFTTFMPSPDHPTGTPCLSGSWPIGQTVSHMVELINAEQFRSDTAAPDGDLYRARALAQIRYIAASMAFMGQRIFTTSQRSAPRSSRKRAVAALGHEPLVRVVELRRRYTRAGHEPGAEKAYELTCQFVVSGHWRQQYYAATNEHRPIYILPFIKGPEGAPLKPPRATVFAAVR